MIRNNNNDATGVERSKYFVMPSFLVGIGGMPRPSFPPSTGLSTVITGSGPILFD